MATEASTTRRSLFAIAGGLAGALALPAHAASAPVGPGPYWRDVQSDNLAPTLNLGDTYLVEPVVGWEGAGIYLLDMGDAETPYRCNRVPGERSIHVWSESRRYGEWRISEADFNRLLRGRVTRVQRSFY